MFEKNKNNKDDYELRGAKRNIDPRAIRLECGGIAIPDPENDFAMFCITCFTVCGSINCPCKNSSN